MGKLLISFLFEFGTVKREGGEGILRVILNEYYICKYKYQLDICKLVCDAIIPYLRYNMAFRRIPQFETVSLGE